MGKKGDLLRAAKKQSAHYTFTGAELEAHDAAVRAAYRKDLVGRLKEEARIASAEYEEDVKQRIRDHWDGIAREFYTPDEQENTNNMISYLLAISSRVLIEKFHWKPAPKDYYDRRNRTVQFAEAVVAELERVTQSENMDIRAYSEETYELYGVKYRNAEVEDGDADDS